MEYKITKLEPRDRPEVVRPVPEILEAIGEEGVRKLISDHYDILVKSEIKHLFPDNEMILERAKTRSSDFFIQLLGGPEYFNKNRGKPMLAARHKPFPIGRKERVVWLECYMEALEKSGLSDELKQSYWNYLDLFSNWMVNQFEDPPETGFSLNTDKK